MHKSLVVVTLLSAVSLAAGIPDRPAFAQDTMTREEVVPMGQWYDFLQTEYNASPILVHLRTGYERAVLMPEPVGLKGNQSSLPGCDIEIDADVIGFYPTRSFANTSIKLVGLETGTEYELVVRSSTLGERQPLQVNR